MFKLTVSDKRVQEGGTVTFTFSVSPTPIAALTVHYSVSGSATGGQDFTLSGTPGEVVIPAGQSSASVTLTALHDGTTENQETVTLTINGTTRGKDFATVFIDKQKDKNKNKGKGKGH